MTESNFAIRMSDPTSSSNPWHGTISNANTSKTRWKFDLVQNSEEFQFLSNTALESKPTWIGLIDYQTPCTIFRPFVKSIDNGSWGINFVEPRQKVSGTFTALIKNIQVVNENDLLFDGFKFTSETLNVWYNKHSYELKTDYENRRYSMDFNDTEVIEFHKSGLGKVTVQIFTRVKRVDGATTISTEAQIRVDCDEHQSLSSIYLECLRLEGLFKFLTAWSPAPPAFYLSPVQKTYLDDKIYPNWAELETSGEQYVSTSKPTWNKVFNKSGLGGADLETILNAYGSDYESLLVRFHVIEFCSHFSNNLNDRFALIMPCFEEFIVARYSQPDEVSFIGKSKEFWDYIDTSNNDGIKEFAKKHIVQKESKAPSLKTQISRAINFVNSLGFSFSLQMSINISARRSQLFHAVANLDTPSVYKLDDEIKCIMSLIAIHTLFDLKIDPSYLFNSADPPSYLRSFLPKLTEQQSS